MTDYRKDEREHKLPRWAQELLAEARSREDRAVSKLNDHLKTVEKTKIWHGSYDNPIYLPDAYGYQRVHFDPVGNGSMHDEFQVQIRDGGLEVSGGRGMAIYPRVSNVINLRLERR
ncbi:hypothetical protein SEA_REFUGE_76 [Mycobacterium phage Refuge]|uniref:Uncharacterized protein n=1 Tax=Mycobacterium phage Refuge TaxID=2517967 RepID=A0A482JED4_9CAUD|nr:hypothetical protein KIV61_gp27 [Mycobacterium phage Refuge]QBP31094.1 hypothetical protein SEA_REFUGE_76 [Mycobacterium phage Refuge]